MSSTYDSILKPRPYDYNPPRIDFPPDWLLSNLPVGGLGQLPKLPKEPPVNTLFRQQHEKTLPFKAVKVTDENVRDVAAEILKALGGTVSVETVTSERTVIRRSHILIASVGDWLVEAYDYVEGVPTFTKATLEEREKHDLR